MGNKKSKNPSEKIQHAMAGHHGPVYALQVPFSLSRSYQILTLA